MTYITVFDKKDHYIVNSFSIDWHKDEPANHVKDGQDWTFGAIDKGRYFMAFDEMDKVWHQELKTAKALAAGEYREPPAPLENIWTEVAINHAASALILDVYPTGKQNTVEKFGSAESKAEMWAYISAVIDVTHQDVGKPWSKTVWPTPPASRIKSKDARVMQPFIGKES